MGTDEFAIDMILYLLKPNGTSVVWTLLIVDLNLTRNQFKMVEF